ncbi:MAG: hypothetical protein VKS61_15105 [Candidatus Sericytochromatia bacterium]|nr:hypothetical protein [Candidatus Sericytochromatia bacterium]
MRNTLLAATALLALTGCALKGARAPQAPIPFADAGFTVMGQTTEEACGTYVFAIDFGHLFANQSASLAMPSTGGFRLPALPIGGPTREEKRALYHALDKIPDATHVLDVRAETQTTGFAPFGIPVFGQRCATVHARGVKIDERPNPQQG